MTANTAVDANSDKARQEAEARGRDPGARGDFAPADEAPADPVVELAAPEAGEGLARREPQGSEDAPARQAKPARGPFDLNRAEMVARFRSERNEADQDAQRDADEIRAFAHSGMPPELSDREAPRGETEAQRRTKLLVRGEQREYTEDEIRALAQKAAAGDDYLAAARRAFDGAKALADEIQAARGAVAGKHPADQNPAQPYEANGYPAEHPGDAYRQLVEKLQYGDPEEAARRLDQLISAAADRKSQEALERTRLADETARSQKILRDFMEQHSDLAQDPMAAAAIERDLYRLQAEDLAALGIPIELLPDRSINGVAQAHLWYRTKGFRVRGVHELLAGARDNFLNWKSPVTRAPTNEQAGRGQRIEVAVDRHDRRAGMPQQPARSSAPRPQPQASGQAPDRSSVVQAMAERRARPRGKVMR